MPNEVKIGTLLDPMCAITDDDELKEYFDAYVQFIMMTQEGMDIAEATRIAQENAGYWAGYHSEGKRAKFERVLGAIHPVLGSVKLNLTSDQILKLGQDYGERIKSKIK